MSLEKIKSYFSKKPIEKKETEKQDDGRYWIKILEERFGDNPLKKLEKEYKGRPIKVKHKTKEKSYVEEGFLGAVGEDFIYIGDKEWENFHALHWDWKVPPSGADRYSIYSIESDLTILYKNEKIDYDHKNSENPNSKKRDVKRLNNLA